MAKRELDDNEKASVDIIIQELCGYSIDEAEMILKDVAAHIRECAIIEEGDRNGRRL